MKDTGDVSPDDEAALFLNNNAFDHLPLNSLGTSHILYLTLADNRFIGSIAPGIVKALSNLTEILFLNNSLTGCILYELGLLTEAIAINVGDNLLTGLLPLSLSCLAKVEQLNFARNQLHGRVREAICLLEMRQSACSGDGSCLHNVWKRPLPATTLDTPTANCLTKANHNNSRSRRPRPLVYIFRKDKKYWEELW